jgi:CheY-like chemotaxis protein
VCSCPRLSAPGGSTARTPKLLASNLKASGYTLRQAADGSEALKLIQEHTFDLLLLEISMPQMRLQRIG